MKPPRPIYTPQNTRVAYQLTWALTIFWRREPIDDSLWLDTLRPATEPDGVRVLKHRLTTNSASQFLISTKPHVTPAALLRSVKGRLQHLVRQRSPKALQRNSWLRSIGSAKRSVVEDYVADQLGHHKMADERLQARLAKLQKIYGKVDLSAPSFTAHGRFWYNLHLVLVNDERWMEIRDEVLLKIQSMIERVAAVRGHRLAGAAIVPDHIHLTLGCPIDRSPEEIALCYLNNCAYACGMKKIFMHSYYVGTFGEYDLGAVP